MLKVVEGSKTGEDVLALPLDELAREGARRMLAMALEEEVEAYLSCRRELRDAKGHALVVRNGLARARKVTLGAGTVEVKAPRINDRRPGERFTSKILPPYMRRSPKVAEVLPILYLRGLSMGDSQEALKGLLGEDAAGLSPANISRLIGVWEEEYEAFRKRDLSGVDLRLRLGGRDSHAGSLGEQDRVCLLVMLGVRPDGTKELIAVEDGYRESTESWAALLRDLKRRGMRAPALATGDGALGFWAAQRDVWPETVAQRDWVHRLANVLDKLPKRLQSTAKEAVGQIMAASTRAHAQQEMARFAADYGAKYPKAVDSLTRDQDALLAFYDFPAGHWLHIRTSNPIESSFATVRLRQRITKGRAPSSAGCSWLTSSLPWPANDGGG
jgi:putative transposase